jgi:DNA segregation ATPase FtsK/SpoIIIE-like protein
MYVTSIDREAAESDPLYQQIKPLIASFDVISAQNLQRRYGIGYNRAARLLEVFAADGVIDWDRFTGKYSAPRR